MENVITQDAPYVRRAVKKGISVSRIMRDFAFALIAIFLFSFWKNGIEPFIYSLDNLVGNLVINGKVVPEGTDGAYVFTTFNAVMVLLQPLLLMLFAITTAVMTEAIFFKAGKKVNTISEGIKFAIFKSYALIPAMLFVFIMPINTPIFIIVLGAFFAVFVGKLVFGGFGFNIFNPAGVGRAIISASFLGIIVNEYGGYLNNKEQNVDAISGSTALETIQGNNWVGSYDQIVKPFGTLWDFFLGNVPGTIGETSALLLILVFIFLLVRKVITWEIPVIYVGTVFVASWIIGITRGIQGDLLGIWYPMFHVLSGGLIFGAVLMATEPITSPTSARGRMIFAFFLGILTLLFRFTAGTPGGVLTAIATMNFFTLIIDKKSAIIQSTKDISKKIISGTLVITTGLVVMLFIIYKIPTVNENVVLSTESEIYLYEEVTESSRGKLYNIGVQAYGTIKMQVRVNDNEIVFFEVYEHYETSGAGANLINDEDYIDEMIEKVNSGELGDIDRQGKDLVESEKFEPDVVTSATITGNALVFGMIKCLEFYEDESKLPELFVPEPLEPLTESEMLEYANLVIEDEDSISSVEYIESDEIDHVFSVLNKDDNEAYRVYTSEEETVAGGLVLFVTSVRMLPQENSSVEQYAIAGLYQDRQNENGWPVSESYLRTFIGKKLSDIESKTDVDSGVTVTSNLLKEYLINLLQDATGGNS